MGPVVCGERRTPLASSGFANRYLNVCLIMYITNLICYLLFISIQHESLLAENLSLFELLSQHSNCHVFLMCLSLKIARCRKLHTEFRHLDKWNGSETNWWSVAALIDLYFSWHNFSNHCLLPLLSLSLFHPFLLRQLSSSVWWNPWWQWSLSFFRPLANTETETLSTFPQQQLAHCHSQHGHLSENWFLVFWLAVLCHTSADLDWLQPKLFSEHNDWEALAEHTVWMLMSQPLSRDRNSSL